MAALTESQHAEDFIVSEAQGSYSRDAVTVLSGQTLKAGHVVGKVALGAGSSAAKAGNTGDGAMGAITVGAGAKVGAYKLTIIEPASDAGQFIVEDPDGVNVGSGTVAVAFTGGGISFTLADGSVNFISGDQFTITVAAGRGTVKEGNPATTDGSAVVAGVLCSAVDASAADKPGVMLVRVAEVNGAELYWFSGASGGNKTTGKAGLATLGVVAR